MFLITSHKIYSSEFVYTNCYIIPAIRIEIPKDIFLFDAKDVLFSVLDDDKKNMLKNEKLSTLDITYKNILLPIARHVPPKFIIIEYYCN